MNPALLEKLQCPHSGARLLKKGAYLVSSDPNHPYRYRIENNIPDLLKDHAELLSASDYIALMEKSSENV